MNTFIELNKIDTYPLELKTFIETNYENKIRKENE